MRFPTILASILAAALLAGCTTTAPGQSATPIVTPERVQAVVKLAAFVTAKAIEKDPEKLVELEAVRDGLQDLADQQVWDVAALANIAAAHGVGALASDEGTLAIAGTTLLLDTVLHVQVDLKSQPYARAVILGALDGLNLALIAQRDMPGETLARLKAEAAATR